MNSSSPSDNDDGEIEAELVQTVKARGKDDPLSAYDMDTAEEGEAIHMYLLLLESGGTQPASDI